MEFRVLQYFLAVAREESVSGAAEYLHLSQPTLSRQLKDLEEELGKQLFIRGNRKITLTEEGMLLRKRAEEIVDLVKKTEEEVSSSDETIAGNIYIGAGESAGNRILAKAAFELKQNYPDVRFHISSGNSVFVMEQLDKGLIDFGVIYGEVNHSKYDSIKANFKDNFVVYMRKDSELAQKEFITPEDLLDKPLIISAQEERDNWPTLSKVTSDLSKIKVVATYTLFFNGSLLVEEGLGYALCFDKLINLNEDSNLCFRPLRPVIEATPHIIWKRYQVHTKAAQKFLEKLQEQQ